MKVVGVYFSPCHSTADVVKTIAEKLAERLKLEKPEYIDYTRPNAREMDLCFSKEDLIVWGTPTYAGRIPNKILPFVAEHVSCNGAVVVPVVTYGNRNFDDSLIELALCMEKNGGTILGAAAVPVRHVFSSVLNPGHPNEQDFSKLGEFACQLAEKVQQGAVQTFDLSAVPGTNPPEKYYTPRGVDGQPAVFLKAKPVADESLCNECHACENVCPMGTLHFEDGKSVPQFAGACIKCHACIHTCETGALQMKDEAFLSHKAMLEENFKTPKEMVLLK